MVTFEELIQKVEEAEKKISIHTNTNQNVGGFFSLLEFYSSDNSIFNELKEEDKYFFELLDTKLIKKEVRNEKEIKRLNGEKTTFGEIRQRLYEKVDKLMDIFYKEFDREIKELEQKTQNLSLGIEQSSSLTEFRR